MFKAERVHVSHTECNIGVATAFINKALFLKKKKKTVVT